MAAKKTKSRTPDLETLTFTGVPFTFHPVDINSRQSVTYYIKETDRRLHEENSRRSNTIHFSSYYKCVREQAYERLGAEKKEDYNWSNKLAARWGECAHEEVQKDLVRSGQAVMIPAFDQDEDYRTMKRNRGMLQPAIEVTIGDWAFPFSARQVSIYQNMGIVLPSIWIYRWVTGLHLGGRLDAVIMLPASEVDPRDVCPVRKTHSCDRPYEIKTIEDKYWFNQEKEAYMYGPTGKWAHYSDQGQLQTHTWRCTACGRRPRLFRLCLVTRANIAERFEVDVEYKPEHIQEHFPRLKQLREDIKNGVVPDGEPSPDNCKFCPFHHLCDHPGKYEKFINYQQIKKDNQRNRQEFEDGYMSSLMASR